MQKAKERGEEHEGQMPRTLGNGSRYQQRMSEPLPERAHGDTRGPNGGSKNEAVIIGIGLGLPTAVAIPQLAFLFSSPLAGGDPPRPWRQQLKVRQAEGILVSCAALPG